MIKFILIALLVALIAYEPNSFRPTEMSARMVMDGIPMKRVRQFVALERRLNELSDLSARTRVSHCRKRSPWARIKEAFPEYDFAFHTNILKRIAEPTKSWTSKKSKLLARCALNCRLVRDAGKSFG